MASAQYFTPDQPEGRGLYLFLSPALNGMTSASSRWMIMHGEQLRVDKLQDNGWCQVHYKSPATGKEFDGYLKMKTLIPLDEQAKELKVEHEKRVAFENNTIRWCIILAVIGLVISFLSFLGRLKDILVAAAVILLSVIEIWFFTHTEGLNFYSPMVVGWKWAVIWFLCFIGFLCAQIFIFFKVLLTIEKENAAVGKAVVFLLLGVLCLIVALLVSTFFMAPITAPTREANIFKVFIAAQALIIVYLFIHTLIKHGFIQAILVTPFFAIGIVAIGYLAYDALVVAIVLMFALPVMNGAIKSATTRQISKKKGYVTERKWVDGVDIMDSIK